MDILVEGYTPARCLFQPVIHQTLQTTLQAQNLRTVHEVERLARIRSVVRNEGFGKALMGEMIDRLT